MRDGGSSRMLGGADPQAAASARRFKAGPTRVGESFSNPLPYRGGVNSSPVVGTEAVDAPIAATATSEKCKAVVSGWAF